jgi:hypothetical protein
MTLSINVPEELYQKAAEIAAVEHATVEEVFASAFAEQVAAWERLNRRAARGSRERFLAVMSKVPDAEPEPYDRR